MIATAETRHLGPELFPLPDEVPERFRLGRYEHGRRYLIDGRVHRWDGAARPVLSPVCVRADGRIPQQPEIGECPLLTKDEALSALEAVDRAWASGTGEWPTASPNERMRCTEYFVAAMRSRREEVALLEMWEIGKPYHDCLKEFDRTVAYVEETLAELARVQRESAAAVFKDDVAAVIRRAPLGPVLCLGPYNYPLNENFTTLIPALVMGNPVIVKLPKYGMLCNLPLLDAFATCFPRGVVNVINGDGPTVVQPIMESGEINVFAFIGSSRAANAIERYHPYPNRVRRIYGLEAKNPAIVLEDADLSVAVRECVTGALSFSGQRCTAIKHIWVADAVADSFLSQLVEMVNRLPIGMPWERDVRITPLPEARKVDYLTGLVEDAVHKGAKILNPGGGTSVGTLFVPAVLYPVSTDMRVFHEEQFGPVIPISPFRKSVEVIAALAASQHGQQVSLFGRDRAQLGRLIDPLTNLVARVNINMQCQRGPDLFPFTGRKDSAIGTLSILDALRSFSIRAMVATSRQDAAVLDELGTGRRSMFMT